MSEEMNLVRDLAVILISAGVFTILSKALKQPLILGYILAGFLIGPNFPFFYGISSTEAVHEWSEIGIIFMMFGLGLEFSFKKLLKVGSGALVTAGTKFIGVFVLGFVIAQALGWTPMESIFLGGLLSMSSTAVVLKSYDDMGLKEKPYAGLVFGTLVVEDLIAILLMVLLSTLAVSNKFEGGEMLFNLGKLAFSLILWFLVGIYVIPTLLKKAKSFLSDEILLIVSIGLCFGMVTLATAAGFSSALGAFVMGSILAETIESEHIEHLVHPIKDLFGAIFFVSVGMMVSPAVIAENWAVILVLTLLVILTHIVFSAAGILITGGGLGNAVHTGFSLAQLGEFGFILAGVGVTLGVMRDFIYPVIIAVSVITTFTTPYMIKAADPAERLLRKRLPGKWLLRLDPPESAAKQTNAEQSEWKKLLRSFFLRMVLYGVILLAIQIGFRTYLEPLLDRLLPQITVFWRNLIAVGATLLAMSPFLYGFVTNTEQMKESTRRLREEKATNVWPLLGMTLVRAFLAIGMVISVISSHFQLAGWVVLLLVVAGIVLFYVARRSVRQYGDFERRFIANLNEKEAVEKRRAPVASSIRDKLAGYDVHIESFLVDPDSTFAGQKLRDIPIRSETGANIIKIQRGTHNYTIPSRDIHLFPGDRILAVGTGEQLGKFRDLMGSSVERAAADDGDTEFEVVAADIRAGSYLCGKTLREVGMRDYRCMVVSILRGEEMITNPKPDLRFAEGDVVWLAGDPSSCAYLAE